uniref:Methyltransferase like 26 n=1 Tax=Malurus cyaneus samueli TaxID=2593467 RepID=A0A8C5U9R0_9PASS
MQVPAAAERNKGPILACAGAGSNAAHFARALPQTRWQPSDNRPGACAGDIAAYVEAAGLPNLLPPIPLDVSQGWESWGGTQPATLDLLVSINMMHIAELRCTEVSSPRRPLSPARAEEGALRGLVTSVPTHALLLRRDSGSELSPAGPRSRCLLDTRRACGKGRRRATSRRMPSTRERGHPPRSASARRCASRIPSGDDRPSLPLPERSPPPACSLQD